MGKKTKTAREMMFKFMKTVATNNSFMKQF